MSTPIIHDDVFDPTEDPRHRSPTAPPGPDPNVPRPRDPNAPDPPPPGEPRADEPAPEDPSGVPR